MVHDPRIVLRDSIFGISPPPSPSSNQGGEVVEKTPQPNHLVLQEGEVQPEIMFALGFRVDMSQINSLQFDPDGLYNFQVKVLSRGKTFFLLLLFIDFQTFIVTIPSFFSLKSIIRYNILTKSAEYL